MNIATRMKISVANSRNNVFLSKDFMKMGSEKQVRMGLQKLICEKRVLRISKGVYVRAKESRLTGKVVPVNGLETVKEAVNRLGYQVTESSSLKNYNSKISTQVPTGRTIAVNKCSKRKFRYDNIEIFLVSY
ncbi:DUF6088 family protein [Acinetobacter pittii]|uniref:DUF6088 family protein n=1 Tax=Acinetobacter pittii TaxID=48296 RepID=UPI00301BF451